MDEKLSRFYPNIAKVLLKQGVFNSQFKAFTVFVDISGFTQLSENLMAKGFEGAEQIRDIIQNHFYNFSRMIYSNGGDILAYSGDAILAIFSDYENCEKAVSMMMHFTKTSNVLSIRAGISYGDVRIRIYRFNGGFAILPDGEGINNAMKAEHSSDLMSFNFVGDMHGITDIPSTERNIHPSIDRDVMMLFREKGAEFGSFAYVAILFLFLDDDDKTISDILSAAENRVYLNKIEKYPEGVRMFFLSGVPYSKSDSVEMMTDFVSDLLKNSFMKSVSGGFTSGYIYNGFSGGDERFEYNLIGNSINRAARIAVKADKGEILFDKKIMEENPVFDGEFRSNETLKGIGNINLYTMRSYRKHSVPLYMPLFGREKERAEIKELFKRSSVVEIGGVQGAGKTHIASSYVFENEIKAQYVNISYTADPSPFSIFEYIDKSIIVPEGDLSGAVYLFMEYLLKEIEIKLLIIDNAEYLDSDSKSLLKKLKKEKLNTEIIIIKNINEGDIILEMLSIDEIEGMIETRTGSPPSRRLSEVFFRQTGGNPYFILAVFRGMVEKHLINLNYINEWDFLSDENIVSGSITSLVQVMVSSLSAEEYNIIKTASCFELPFSTDIFIEINKNMPVGKFEASLDELVGRGIFYRLNRAIYFVNETVKEHIYKSILVKEREIIHKVISEGFESVNNILEAGVHRLKCGDFEKAKLFLSGYKKLYDGGQINSALRYAMKLFEIEKSETLLIDIIEMLLKEGRPAEAERVFEESKMLLNHDMSVFLNMIILRMKGDREMLKSFILKEIEGVSDDKIKLKMTDEIAFTLAVLGDDKAAFYAEKVVDLNNKTKSEYAGKLKIGATFREMGDYDNSEKMYTLAYDIALKNGNEIEAYSLLTDMVSMMPTGRFSVDYIIEINMKYLSLLEKNDMKIQKLKAYKSLIISLRDKGEYDKAEEIGLSALNLASFLKQTSYEAIILMQLGRMQFNRGKNERSIDLFLKAAQKAERIGSILLLESIYGNIGVCFHVMKDYKSAYEYYERALELSLKVIHSETRFLWILNLALLGVESKQMEKAEPYIEMAREEIKKGRIEERWLDVEQIAGNCAFLQGDYERCKTILAPVLKEAEKRKETEIYYEALPYFAGSLIMLGDNEGVSLLNSAEKWADEKSSENVKNNIIDVKKVTDK